MVEQGEKISRDYSGLPPGISCRHFFLPQDSPKDEILPMPKDSYPNSETQKDYYFFLYFWKRKEAFEASSRVWHKANLDGSPNRRPCSLFRTEKRHPPYYVSPLSPYLSKKFGWRKETTRSNAEKESHRKTDFLLKRPWLYRGVIGL